MYIDSIDSSLAPLPPPSPREDKVVATTSKCMESAGDTIAARASHPAWSPGSIGRTVAVAGMDNTDEADAANTRRSRNSRRCHTLHRPVSIEEEEERRDLLEKIQVKTQGNIGAQLLGKASGGRGRKDPSRYSSEPAYSAEYTPPEPLTTEGGWRDSPGICSWFDVPEDPDVQDMPGSEGIPKLPSPPLSGSGLQESPSSRSGKTWQPHKPHKFKRASLCADKFLSAPPCLTEESSPSESDEEGLCKFKKPSLMYQAPNNDELVGIHKFRSPKLVHQASFTRKATRAKTYNPEKLQKFKSAELFVTN